MPILAFSVKLFSSTALFFYIAFVSFVLFAFGLYSLKTVKAVSQEEQVDFVAMPRLSPIASGLDPRTDEEKK